MKERIIIVDKNDNIIGSKERGGVTKDDIYRVAALWVTNLKGDILLAKRDKSKAHRPQRWGPAVAGTVKEGETYEQSMIREAEEEIGLKDVTFTVGPKKEVEGEYHYFCQWYVLVLDKPLDEFKPRKGEVEALKWFSREELKKLLDEEATKCIPHMNEIVGLFIE